MSFLTRRNVGKIQIILGVVLIIAVIFGYYSIEKSRTSAYVKAYQTMSEFWAQAGNTTCTLNAEGVGGCSYAREVAGGAISSSFILGSLFGYFIYLLKSCAAILVVLSIMLILQGLANISRK